MRIFALFLLLQLANANSRCYKCFADDLHSDCYKGHKMAEHQCNDENGCAVEVVSKYYQNYTVTSEVKRDCKTTINAQVPINNLPGRNYNRNDLFRLIFRLEFGLQLSLLQR